MKLDDGERAYLVNTLRYLCRASRVAGSEWNHEVCQFIRDQLNAFGCRTVLQESSFTGWELFAPPVFRYLSPTPREALGDCLPVVWSGGTDSPVRGIVRAQVPGIPAVLLTFETYEWQVFAVVSETTGEVVACLLGGPMIWPQPRDDAADPTPYLMVSPADWAFLRDCLARGVEVRVEVAIASQYIPGRTLRNVIANPGAGTIVCAHYDSFFSTTGFHDNASGLAVLLLLARRGRLNATLVAFDAEEWNKLGSYWFVETAAGVERVINIDSVAVGEGLYLASSQSLVASVKAAAQRSGAKAPLWMQPLEGMAQFDTWPFLRRGIPAVQIGSEGRRAFRDWHMAGDNIGLLTEKALDLMEAVVAVVEALAK